MVACTSLPLKTYDAIYYIAYGSFGNGRTEEGIAKLGNTHNDDGDYNMMII